MNSAYFSASQLTFIPAAWKDDGTYTGENWPTDAVLLNDDEALVFWKQNPPAGKKLGSDNGRPAWIDLPPPTQDEYIAMAEQEKERRIDAANDYMDSRQWPGKAAMKRLSTDDFAKYNLWLDYLDALEALDTSPAPDIEWPEPPQ